LREGINSSPRINALSKGAEILYRRLMSVADDYGRFHGSPITIRGACWPTCPEKVLESDIQRWLGELTVGERPLVTLYKSNVLHRNRPTYLQINDFGQQIRAKSKFPEPAINLISDCSQNDSDTQSAPITTTNTTTSSNTDTNTTSKRVQGETKITKLLDGGVFRKWLEPWPRVSNPEGAARAWILAVNSPDDEAAAFAARDRYLASEEVARKIFMDPVRWLYEQSRSGWSGKWPRSGEEPSKDPTLGADTEAFIAYLRANKRKPEDTTDEEFAIWRQHRHLNASNGSAGSAGTRNSKTS
jgi:hypothetical protein